MHKTHFLLEAFFWIASKLSTQHKLSYKPIFSSTGFPGGPLMKKTSANAEDAGDAVSIPGSGRPPGGGNDNPLQYSCLESPMERGRLLGYSTWVGKEWNMTEQLSKNIHTHFSSTRCLVVNSKYSVFTMGWTPNIPKEIKLREVRELAQYHTYSKSGKCHQNFALLIQFSSVDSSDFL